MFVCTKFGNQSTGLADLRERGSIGTSKPQKSLIRKKPNTS